MIYLAALGAATATMLIALAIDFAWTRCAALWEGRRSVRLAPPRESGQSFMDSIEFDWPERAS